MVRKFLLLSGFLFFFTMAFSQTGYVSGASLDDFPPLKFDTLHIHTFAPYGMPSEVENTLLPPKMHPEIPMCRFPMDRARKWEAFLVSSPDHKTVSVYIVDLKEGKPLTRLEVAHYKYIAGAVESTMNSWVLDLDGDGILEIATVVNLRDFEMPTDDAPNISGTTQYYHAIVDGKMEYRAWPADLDLGPLKK